MLRTEEEVDAMIADMVKRNKGKYITQAVAFNKSCPRQMMLLKKALMASVSFSGLGKELLALRFDEKPSHLSVVPKETVTPSIPIGIEQKVERFERKIDKTPVIKSVGNFI